MMRIHVTLGYKKLILDTTTETLIADIRTKFDVQQDTNIYVQHFDIDFKDWINIEPEDVVDLEKLNVYTTKSDCVINVENVVNDDLVSSDGDASARQMTIKTPEMTMKEHQATDPPKRAGSGETIIMMLQPWPVPFRLPLLRADLCLALDRKTDLSRKLRIALVQSCFDEMLKYTIYPTPSQYREVAIRIVTTYPHLKDKMPNCQGYEKWCAALSDKFRNERKHMDIEVVQKKKKRHSLPENNIPRNVWNLQEPTRPVGEDDDSIELHLKWLTLESRKASPDSPKIKLLMDLTFADRRKLVLSGSSLFDIRQKFPCLFEMRELCNEFQRLTQKDLGQMDSTLLSVAKQLLDVNALKKEKSFIESLLKEVEAAPTQKSKSDILCAGALWILPSFFRSDDRDYLITKVIPTGMTSPVILQTGDRYTIQAEGETICIADNIVDSFKCLISAYYAFNLAYHKKNTCTLSIIQFGFLKFHDSVPLQRSISSFLLKFMA